MSQNEELILSVGYEGSAGVQQFVGALQPLPGQIESIFERIARQDGGGLGIGGDAGRRLARSFYEGYQATIAGFSFFEGTTGAANVLDQAGLSDRDFARTKANLAQVRRLMEDLTRNGLTGQGPERDFSQATVLGLRETERASERARQEIERLGDSLRKLELFQGRLIRAGISDGGIVDALDGSVAQGTVGWTSEAQRFMQAAGLPPLRSNDLVREPTGLVDVKASQNQFNEIVREQLGAAQQQVQATREMVQVLRNAPVMSDRVDRAREVMKQPRQEVVAQADERVRAERRQTPSQTLPDGRVVSGRQLPGGWQAELDRRSGGASAGLPTPRSLQDLADVSRLAREQLQQSASGTGAVLMRAQEVERERLARAEQAADAQMEARLREARAAEQSAIRAAQQARVAGPPPPDTSLRDRIDRAFVQRQLDPGEEAFGISLRERLEMRAQQGQAFPTRAAATPAQTFRNDFMAGFSGPESSSFGEMVGQTARIALFYGVAYRGLTLLQNAISAVIAESVQFQSAITDLSLATNQSRSNVTGLAEELAGVTAAAGFSPTEGGTLGARAVGLWGLAGGSLDEQSVAARTTAEVASQIARTSGADLQATATQLVGTARAFNLGVEELTRIQDSVTYMSRFTGQDANQLLGATANIATLGLTSGFTLEQLMAIVAQVGTTTGQNPEATAGQFRQVLSRDFATVAGRAQDIFGIDTSDLSTVAQVLERVSQVGGTEDQLSQFAGTFGKGGSQAVALITLQNWERIQQLSSGASSASGLGQEAFDTAMADIGQAIRVMASEWMEFGLLLTQTGILDWMTLVVSGATSVAEALQVLVGWFNEIPRPLRSIGFAVAEFVALSALLRSNTGTRLLGGLGPWATRGAQGVAAVPGALGAMFPTFAAAGQGLAARGAGAWAAGSSFVGGLTAPSYRGRVDGPRVPVVSGAGLLGAAAGVAVAVQQIQASFEAASAGSDELAEALQASAAAIEPDDYRAAAQQARVAGQAARDATVYGLETGDVANLLPSLIATFFGDNLDRADEAAQLAADLEARAVDVEQRRASVFAADPASVFADFSVDGISSAMQELQDRGFTAAQAVDLLSDALFRNADLFSSSAAAVVSSNQYDALAGEIGAGVSRLGAREGDRLMAQYDVNTAWGALDPRNILSASSDAALRRDAEALQGVDPTLLQGAVRDSVLSQLESFGDTAVLSEGDVNLVVERTREAAAAAFPSEVWQQLEEESRRAILNGVEIQTRQALGSFSPASAAVDLTGYLAGAPQNAEVVGQAVARQTGSALAGSQARVQALRDAVSNTRAREAQSVLSEDEARFLEQVEQELVVAKRDLVSARLAEVDRLTQLQLGGIAEDDVSSQLAARMQGVQERSSILQNAISQTLREGGDPTALTQELQGVQNEGFQIQRQGALDDLAKLQTQMRNVSPGNAVGQAAGEYSAVLAAINSGLYEDGELQMMQLRQQLTQAAFSLSSARVSGVNANALANVDPRNDLGRVTQQIANARREMSLYSSSDARFGQLRDQINQLQVQYVQGLANRANAMAAAEIAGGNSGLRQAQVGVASAQRTLQTQLRGTEGYYNALAALRQAKLQLAQEERAQTGRLARLDSDLTDPVEQARLDALEARREFNAAKRRGDGPDAVAQARLDLRNARNAREAAQFDQRLSDIQTAEELGRITHSQYMNYLQSEHDRLSAIADRTRQQQEQLDQVDKLMKSAVEQMQGQFNLGDIELPTVYEMRRAIGSGMGGGVNDYSNSNNTVVINGADFGQVVAYIESLMGGASFSTTTVSGRKV